MKLVIDGRRLTTQRTGVGRYLELLLSEWSRSGLPVSPALLVLQDPPMRERVPAIPGMTIEVGRPSEPGLLWELAGLGSRLHPGDILFAPANLVPMTWRGKTLLVLHDLLVEAHPRGFSPWTRWWFGRRYRAASHKAARILVPSVTTARDVQRFHGVSSEQIRVIPLGTDPAFKPRDPYDEDVFQPLRSMGLQPGEFVLFVGKQSARRNLPLLFSAFSLHSREFPDDRLVLAGPATNQAAMSRCSGITEVGHVSEKSLRALYNGAIALAYLSEYEGFGLPLVEAMASGCPVVALRQNAVEEVGGDAVIGLDRLDPVELAGHFRQLRGDTKLRGRAIERGLLRARDFDQARFAAAVAEELKALAGCATTH